MQNRALYLSELLVCKAREGRFCRMLQKYYWCGSNAHLAVSHWVYSLLPMKCQGFPVSCIMTTCIHTSFFQHAQGNMDWFTQILWHKEFDVLYGCSQHGISEIQFGSAYISIQACQVMLNVKLSWWKYSSLCCTIQMADRRCSDEKLFQSHQSWARRSLFLDVWCRMFILEKRDAFLSVILVQCNTCHYHQQHSSFVRWKLPKDSV